MYIVMHNNYILVDISGLVNRPAMCFIVCINVSIGGDKFQCIAEPTFVSAECSIRVVKWLLCSILTLYTSGSLRRVIKWVYVFLII